MVPAGGSPTINNSANDHHFLGQGSMSKGIKKIPRSSRNVDTTTWQKYIQSSLQEKLPIRSGTLNNTQVVQLLGGVGFGGSKGYLDGSNLTRGAGGKREGSSEGVGNGGGSPNLGGYKCYCRAVQWDKNQWQLGQSSMRWLQLCRWCMRQP